MWFYLRHAWPCILLGLLLPGAALSACSPRPSEESDAQAPHNAATLIAQRGDTSWDLVAIGDSTPTGYGVLSGHSYVDIYAGYIEQDLGIPVQVHNRATTSTRTVEGWVEEIRGNEELRQDIRDAEVITIWLGWHDLIPSIGVPRGGPCYPHSHEVDLACLAQVASPMQAAFDNLLAEIESLVDTETTLILIADAGIPRILVESWTEDGTFDILQEHAYEVWREYILQAASNHHAVVVHTYETLNGPNGDRAMPTEYMQSDGVHFNDAGHILIADMHRQVGYEFP
jgi:lysophospholipase L1-like esterase